MAQIGYTSTFSVNDGSSNAQAVFADVKTVNVPFGEGFRIAGVNAQDLIGLPINEQFMSLAESISRLPRGAQQASAAMRIFGSTEILGPIQRGRAGIEEYINRLQSSGAILSSTQLTAATEASRAWRNASRDLSNSWRGVSNQLTIAFAPVVSGLATGFARVMEFLRPVFGWISRGISQVSRIFSAVFEVIGQAISSAVDWVRSLMASVEAMGFQWPSIEQIVTGVFWAIGMAGAYAFDTIRAGIGAVTYALSFVVDGVGYVVRAFEGLTDLARHIPDAMRPQWVDRFADRVTGARETIQSTATGMRRFGADAVTSFGRSSQAVDRFFNNLGNRREEAAAANDEFEGGGNLVGGGRRRGNGGTGGRNEGIGAVTFGSKEAYSIEAQWRWQARLGQGQQNIQQQQLQVQQQQLQEMRQINENLEDMGDLDLEAA